LTSERPPDKILLTLHGEGVPAPKVRASYELLEKPQLLERELSVMIKTPREPRNKQILREEWGEKGGI